MMNKLNDSQETNATVSIQIDKKILRYIHVIRLWYLVCPLAAFALTYYDMDSALHIYEIAIGIFGAVCICSQFFSSTSWGIDLEQYNLHKEAESKAKKQWDQFYTSPVLLCLPCILVIAVIEISKIVHFVCMM